MKTAISLPDDTFEQATKKAHELGISRSEFFATAAKRFLDELARPPLTVRIDQALDAASQEEPDRDDSGRDDSGRAAIAAGRRRLAREDDW